MIQPALSPEEWADITDDRPFWREVMDRTLARINGFLDDRDEPRLRFALAALCLEDAPFGFTREDVRALRREWADEWEGVGRPNDGDAVLSIADRIEALLPPESVAPPEGGA